MRLLESRLNEFDNLVVDLKPTYCVSKKLFKRLFLVPSLLALPSRLRTMIIDIVCLIVFPSLMFRNDAASAIAALQTDPFKSEEKTSGVRPMSVGESFLDSIKQYLTD
jgi:hypothetical protein